MVLLGLTALISSFAAKACPDLEGEYLCRGEGQTQEVQIQQELRNDVWTYHLTLGNDELTVLTDGEKYELGNFQQIKNATYQAKCENQKLMVKASGDIFVASRSFRAQSEMSFTPASNGQINSRAKLILDGRNLRDVRLKCRTL